MRAKLEFELPEDNQEFRLATKASAIYTTLWDLDQWLRAEIKYQGREQLDEIRDKLRELMNDNHIDFDIVE
jgi:hypothetical protein